VILYRYAHDAVLLLAQAIADVKANGSVPNDGVALQRALSFARVSGASGPVYYGTKVDVSGTLQPTDDPARLGELGSYVIYNNINQALIPLTSINITTIDDAFNNPIPSLQFISVPRFSSLDATIPNGCPSGTYGLLPTAIGAVSCLPCQAGSWSPANTNASCLPCSSTTECPFAAVIKIPSDSGISKPSVTLVQPPSSGSLTEPEAISSLFATYAIVLGSKCPVCAYMFFQSSFSYFDT
jgi:hypothetical protein